MTRLCTHPDHLQYGLGHIPGPPLAVEYAAVPVALPATYARTVQAPVLNQSSTPQCEGYTAVTGRRITQPPVGQDGFDPGDIFRLGGGGSGGATTAGIEAALLSPGALCTTGPDASQRKPVASCQNISTLVGLKSALMAEQFVGLAVAWDESWFNPRSNGVLPPRSGVLAGYHIFDVWGWSDDGTLPVGAPPGVPAPGVPAVGGQNSWGTGWGKGGFFWLPYSMLESPLSAYTQIAKLLPVSEVTVQLLPKPVRIFDGPLPAKVTEILTVAGAFGIPATATGIVAIVRAVLPGAAGWVYVGPDQGGVPSTSTLDYNAGQIQDGFPTALLTNGKLTVYSIQPLARFVIDVTGFLTP
jgi:hypothetical protein